jgi:hypothetical protein
LVGGGRDVERGVARIDIVRDRLEVMRLRFAPRRAVDDARARARDGDAASDRRAATASPATIASKRALSAESSAAIAGAGYRDTSPR